MAIVLHSGTFATTRITLFIPVKSRGRIVVTESQTVFVVAGILVEPVQLITDGESIMWPFNRKNKVIIRIDTGLFYAGFTPKEPIYDGVWTSSKDKAMLFTGDEAFRMKVRLSQMGIPVIEVS